MIKILQGDCREVLKTLPEKSVQCCVTSPPYWGLRDYGHADQIGQEATPEAYMAAMVGVFTEVWRVLKDDGTLWLNLGDTYASAWSCNRRNEIGNGSLENGSRPFRQNRLDAGVKEKDLIGIPWIVAFALQRHGWYLRQDIIWAKPNPMPESVTDRCTKSHEYIFLLSKSPRYYYDNEAIKEPASDSFKNDSRWETGPTTHNDKNGYELSGAQNPKNPHSVFLKGRGGKNAFRGQDHFREGDGPANREGRDMTDVGASVFCNKRSVWTVTAQPYKEAHFATFPPDLIKPCILAGSRAGDMVLDPFGGSGTTGEVALELGRRATLIELNPDYVKLIEKRTFVTPGLPLV